MYRTRKSGTQRLLGGERDESVSVQVRREDTPCVQGGTYGERIGQKCARARLRPMQGGVVSPRGRHDDRGDQGSHAKLGPHRGLGQED